MSKIQQGQLAAAIMHHPALYHIRYSKKPEISQQVVESYIGAAVDRVIRAYEWSFATSVKDESIVSGQRDYVLKGKTNDCMAVFNVRYGSGDDDAGYALLDKHTKTSIDAYLHNRSVIGVWAWVPQEPVGQFPSIRIIATPTDNTKVLRYRYWVNNLTYESLPGNYGFDMLVLDAVLEELVPEEKARRRFDARLHDVISSYVPSGGEDDPMVLDPYTRQRNNERNRRHGYGVVYD